jgi:hypothetical protein
MEIIGEMVIKSMQNLETSLGSAGLTRPYLNFSFMSKEIWTPRLLLPLKPPLTLLQRLLPSHHRC